MQETIYQDTTASGIEENITLPDSLEIQLEKFFGSKGVVTFNAVDPNLNTNYRIMNEDGSVYAVIDLKRNKVEIERKQYSLSDFRNNDVLRTKYSFFPKEFYPDNFIFQFEYANIEGSLAEVFIDKAKGIRKYLTRNETIFKIESWKEHLIGCTIDFDRTNTPVYELSDLSSKRANFDLQKGIFIISEIKGDMIKIECSEQCGFTCDNTNKAVGWIKWKDGQKLLIRLLYSC